MARYINADEMRDKIEEITWYHITERGTLMEGANSTENFPLYKADDVYKAIIEVPAADVVKVRHGTWNSVDADVVFACSKCGAEISTSWEYYGVWNYCPNCGANMDGGEE